MMYCNKISLQLDKGILIVKGVSPKMIIVFSLLLYLKIMDDHIMDFDVAQKNFFLIPYLQLILIFLVVMVIIPLLNLKEKFRRNGFLNVFSILKIQWWFHVSKGILFIIIIYINNNKRFSSIYIQHIPTTHSNHL